MPRFSTRSKSRLNTCDEKLVELFEEVVKGYGWHCDGNEIRGHYVTTENYKLFYNLDAQFIRMQALRELETVSS